MDPILRNWMQFKTSKSVLKLDQIHLPIHDLELMDFILPRIYNSNISIGAHGERCNKVYRMLGIQIGKFLTP
jgi:hypothetical protein